jgi:N-acetylneuraminic acid mutarotase
MLALFAALSVALSSQHHTTGIIDARATTRARIARTAQNGCADPTSLPGRWVDLAPLGEPRQEVGVAELGGWIYVAGGFTEGPGVSANVEAYDPTADRWQFVAPLPIAVHHAALATAGGKLYLMGGDVGLESVSSDAVFEYDPAANAWTRRASMPTARSAMAVGVIDGRIYLAGGQGGERDFARYDPATDTWTVLPPMPTPRNHLAGGAIGSVFYAAGGRSASITNALEAFDTITGAWTQLPSMPTARGGNGASVLNGCLYVFGGEGNRSSPVGIFHEVEVFDPVANRWLSLDPMAVPRHGIAATTLGNRMYIPGGALVEGFGTTPIHQALQID